MRQLLVPTTEQLHATLAAHGVPVEQYGKGAAKSIRHLFEELQLCECTLWVEGSTQVLRVTRVLALDIYKGEQRLVETKQVFTIDGRERVRDLDSSTGEKMKPNEEPIETAARLILEEMPFLRGVPIHYIGLREVRKGSQSYPGILTLYQFHKCEISVPEEDIPDIVVVEKDKSVYYRWRNV